MQLKQLGTNQTLVNYNDGTEVFFSYETPVAGFHPDLGYVKTANWYSSTTTRHINKYLGVITIVNEVPQEIVNSLANGCYRITDYTQEQIESTTCEEMDDEPIKLYGDYSKDDVELLQKNGFNPISGMNTNDPLRNLDSLKELTFRSLNDNRYAHL